jgi:hypothetical protein
MIVQKVSVFSGKINSMDLPVTQQQLDHWKATGALIQEVFPDLSPSEREFLLTGATQEEWIEAFPSLEE